MKRLVTLALFAASVFAQVQSGRIVGTVMDPNGAVVPAAQVAITAVATNQSVSTQTNGSGAYAVTGLNPGIYSVRVTMGGFQTVAVNQVEIVVGQSARVDVTLKLGETSTTVDVTTTAPLLDTESGTLGHVITNKQIVDLPLNGRSFYELARLLPGGALLPGGGNLLRIRANYISGTVLKFDDDAADGRDEPPRRETDFTQIVVNRVIVFEAAPQELAVQKHFLRTRQNDDKAFIFSTLQTIRPLISF